MAPGNNGHGQGGGQGGLPGNPLDVLNVAPEAVPGLRAAFTAALSRIDGELGLDDIGLRVEPWAKDPVSAEAATAVNGLTADDQERAALLALRTFRAQLDTAVHNLDKITEQYRLLEEDNSATVTQKGSQG
ncbi:transcriptional regulator [Actinokineospora sp. PR83]|uniref:transcriptional regulator n=1 Tax=Actinokineospora sp. PR83 TaxID=2884908 RepID=UPI001F2E29C7|nr:transcriptional regulator [Actinokineospora sp. PR83]MCG8919396.1 transcriptional regulator [Actinokineospora sp. PR83]